MTALLFIVLESRLLAVPLWIVERRANTRSVINRASESHSSLAELVFVIRLPARPKTDN